MGRSDEREAGGDAPAASTDRPGPTSGSEPAQLRIESIRFPSRYEILEELGRGGMGAVYRAYDRVARHDVALKVLHGVSAADRLRLKSEFRALSDIVHPNLIVLHDLVIDDNACFFTMELVRGRDFAEHVRAVYQSKDDPGARAERIRGLARQLALAIDALHQADKLHCDIKPSNVLVTEAGRVVLVDFGLVYPAVAPAARGGLDDELSSDAMRGTPTYMAPEQLWGRAPSRESDWYSFGATLHDALSGRFPTRLELASARGRGALRSRGVELPPDLDDLVARLLHEDAAKRPTGTAVLACLGGAPVEDIASQSRRVAQSSPELIGRGAHLEVLRSALRSGSGVRAVRVFGSSGIGKSALVRGFVQELSAEPRTLVLRSRCHPQEALAFNALDGLIDDLRRELSRGLLGDQPICLPPSEYEAVTRLFPVLAHVLSPDVHAAVGPSPSDREQRHLAFSVVREILRRVSDRYRVVVWLDDLQWGDHDSGNFLRDLLRAQKGPSLLLVASYRAEDEAESPCLQVLREDADAWQATTPLPVTMLGERESVDLVGRLLGADWKGDPSVRDALIRSASGSPFLLTELGLYLSEHPTGTEVDYDEILHLRTRAVSPHARAALEVLAVAGAPLEQGAILRAANLSPTERGLLASLERLSILRTTDLRSRHFEFYHDKLREEVVRRIDGATRSRHHKTIAQALVDGETPNHLGALDHFDAAGDLESVRRYVVLAADHALRVFAFERAATLYRRAIDLESSDAPMHELHRRLASALGSAGSGREAARSYASSADLLERAGGERAEDVVQLRQSAADQFIQAGHFVEGTETLRKVLATYGVRLPRSRNQALLEASALRLLAFAGDFLPRRAGKAASHLDKQRFDALWVANTRLAMVDYPLSSYATARCFIDAVRMGDPSRLSRALGMEAAFTSTFPPAFMKKRSLSLLSRAEELARAENATPYDPIFALAVRSIVSFYNGRFRETWESADRATALLAKHRAGRTWEDAPWQAWSLFGLVASGELAELIRRVRAAADDAALRNDHYVEQVVYLGGPHLAWLALDQVSEARRRTEQTIRWMPPTYSVQHFGYYVTTIDYDLYEGDGLSAWERAHASWGVHAREYLLMITFVRDELLRTRGRAALAAAVALGQRGLSRTRSSHTRRQLLAFARRDAKTMASHELPSSWGFAALLSAGIARATDRSDAEALRDLRAAADAFDAADMQLMREVTRYCAGRVLPGSEGRRELSRAEAWFRDQGVVVPEKLVASQAPGFAP